jgi:hypothetical protein
MERAKPEVSMSDDVLKSLKKEASAAKADGGATASSVAKKPGGRKGGAIAVPVVRLQVGYSDAGTVLDSRPQTSASIGGSPSTARLQITQFLPTLSLRAFEDSAMRADLEARLPVRTVRAGRSDAATGTEFGGVDVGFVAIAHKFLQLRGAYADRRSTRLGLHDPLREVSGGLTFVQNERASRENIDIQARVGADARIALGGATPGLGGVSVQYGPAWGVNAQAGLSFNFGEGGIIRLGSEALLRRAKSFRSGGFDMGGAGLLSLSPYLEYGLSPDVALGVRYDHPFSRPAGREYVMGDPGLAGLYGPAWGANLRVSTF